METLVVKARPNTTRKRGWEAFWVEEEQGIQLEREGLELIVSNGSHTCSDGEACTDCIVAHPLQQDREL